MCVHASHLANSPPTGLKPGEMNEQSSCSRLEHLARFLLKLLGRKLLTDTIVLLPLLLLQVKRIPHGLGDPLLSFPDRCAQRVPEAGCQVAAGQELQQVPRADGSGRRCSRQIVVVLFSLADHALNIPR